MSGSWTSGLGRVAEGVLDTLLAMAPYLLLGFAVAGVVSLVLTQAVVRRHLGRGRRAGVWKAALFGIPLPLCSCGVIPVAMSLRRQGASRGAVASFLISTPQTGVDGFLVKLGMLGLAFALFTPVAALISGVVGGFLVGRLIPDPDPGDAGTECSREPAPEHPAWRRALRTAFIQLPGTLADPLLLGLVVAGAIRGLLPEDLVSTHFPGGLGGKLLVLAVSMPVYVCSTASVPVAAALVHAGVSPGTALVLLIGGPGVNAATVTALASQLGRRTAAVYVLTIAALAIAAGTTMDWMFGAADVDMPPPLSSHEAGTGSWVMAGLLLVLLAGARLGRRTGNRPGSSPVRA